MDSMPINIANTDVIRTMIDVLEVCDVVLSQEQCTSVIVPKKVQQEDKIESNQCTDSR